MNPDPFEVTSSEFEGGHVVAVRGELDLDTAPQFEEVLEAALSLANSVLIIDLSACEFIDSTGIALIVSAWRRLDRNGDGDGGGHLILCGIRGQVHRVLEICGLQSAISMHESLEEVLAGLAIPERF